MTNQRSNLFAKLEFTQFYQQDARYNSVSISALFMEAECFNTPGYITTYTMNTHSEKKIVFGLGFIVTLLLLSVIQLHQSLNVTPPQLVTIDTKKNFNRIQTFLTATFAQKNNRERQNINIFTEQVEMMVVKNTTSLGKF